MRIVFTPSARRQFLAALQYIREDDPAAANNFRLRAQRHLKRLTRFPNSGRVVPEFPELPFREVVVPPYRFFYRIAANKIWIAAVWHGAQLPLEPGQK